ncbi:MAG TPA: elongation factor G [Chloroflexota bacterium]|nr:elongation factor G [Chloroflexota bacterium]
MKDYAVDKLRTVVLASHQGGGKTSLAEAMLFDTGVTTRLGKVDEGTTVSDHDPDEIQHKISISNAVLPIEWKEHKINVIDTPGYADFVGEVMAAVRIADAALILVSAVDGVQVGTEQSWDYCAARSLPTLFDINKLDRENADFASTLAGLRERFGTGVVPVQAPIGREHEFSGLVDLISMKAFAFEDGKPKEVPIPGDIQAEIDGYREQLIDAVCETDDELLGKYLDGGELDAAELAKCLHQAVLSRSVFPVFITSATHNIGIPQLLDAMVALTPNPVEAGVNGESKPAALVFKTVSDPYVGKLNYFRVFSGAVKNDSHVFNVTRGSDEHIGPTLFIQGKHQEHVPQIGPGDIGAVAKLHVTGTGDTLTVKDAPIQLDPIPFPAPAYGATVKPRTKADLDRLGQALHRLMEEDPTLSVDRDAQTGETILHGVGESHLSIAVERLRRKYSIDLDLGDPRIPYRETITAPAKAEGKHKKQSGGRGQFGDVWIELEPNPDSEFEFVNKIVGGAVPKQYIPAVEKGIHEAMAQGFLAGYPVINVRATLYDGKYHDVDSSEMAFKIAGGLAFREAIAKCNPVLLEPIMEVEVTVPDSYMGDVIGDLTSKRARILGMEPAGLGTQRVKAHVPMAEMGHYATALRSITQGRGSFRMQLLDYEQVPAHAAQKVIEESQKRREQDGH